MAFYPKRCTSSTKQGIQVPHVLRLVAYLDLEGREGILGRDPVVDMALPVGRDKDTEAQDKALDCCCLMMARPLLELVVVVVVLLLVAEVVVALLVVVVVLLLVVGVVVPLLEVVEEVLP